MEKMQQRQTKGIFTEGLAWLSYTAQAGYAQTKGNKLHCVNSSRQNLQLGLMKQKP
jgi:hypothetical protein